MQPTVKTFIDQWQSRNCNNTDETASNTNGSDLSQDIKIKQTMIECFRKSILKNIKQEHHIVEDDICKLCEGLYTCLAQRFLPKSKMGKYDNPAESTYVIYSCCALLALMEVNVKPNKCMSLILKGFGVSVFDCWNLTKKLLTDSKLKALADHFEMINVHIQQVALWETDSILWTELPVYENRIPSYEEIKSANGLQLNSQRETSKQFIRLSNNNTEKPSPPPPEKPTDVKEIDLVTSKAKHQWKYSFLSTLLGTYSYAFQRFTNLCEILCVSECLQDMWTSFNHALTSHCQDIFCGRHLDQLVLCIIYTVCKSKIPVQQLQFKTIFQAYKGLPNSDPNIQECNKSIGDLVSFYNKVFLPTMRNFLKLNLKPSKEEAGSLQHSPLPITYNSPVRITKNISISPMRNGLPSPQRCMEYKFSSSPGSQLQKINKMLKNSPVTKCSSTSDISVRCAKRISFSGDDEIPTKSKSRASLFR